MKNKNAYYKKRRNTSHKKVSNNVIDMIYEQLTQKRKHASSFVSKRNIPENLPNIKKPKMPDTTTDIPKDVFIAFYDESTDAPISFTTALEKIKHQETLDKGEEIVYIGTGEFAVITYKKEGGHTIPQIVRKIPFERHRDNLPWRDDLCYELSLSYELNPAPISELYTEEECVKFSHLNNR